MFQTIFTAAFVVCALFAMLIGMLRGRKYNWLFSISRLIIAVVSAVLAVFASRFISLLIGKILIDNLPKITAMMGSDAEKVINDLMTSVNSMPDAIKAIVAMVIAPAIFFTVFIIIKAILNCFSGILCGLLMKIGKKKAEPAKEEPVEENFVAEAEASESSESAETTDESAEPVLTEEAETKLSKADKKAMKKEEKAKKKEEKKKKKRFYACRSTKKFDGIGALCGALCSFIVFVVMLVPILCPLDPIDSAVQMAVGGEDDGVMALVTEISDAAANNLGTKTVKTLGGDLIYNGLTTYRVGEVNVSLKNEMKLVNVAGDVIAVVDDDSVAPAEKAEAVRAIKPVFAQTDLIPVLASDLISVASNRWIEGEEFCGAAMPEFGETVDPLAKELISIMKDSTVESFKADASTIIDALAIIVEEDAMKALNGGENALDLFKNEKLLSGVILCVLENDRLSSMVVSITDLGIGVLADTLKLPANDEAMYEGFISDIYDAMHAELPANLTKEAELIEFYGEKVQEVYDNYGIKISAGVSECVVISIMDTLNADSDKDSYKDFFADSAPLINQISAKKDSVIYLSGSNGSNNSLGLIDRIVKRVDLAIGEISLESLTRIVKEEIMACTDLNDENAAALAEKMASDMYGDIKDKKLSYKNAAVVDAETVGKTSVRVTKDELGALKIEITDKQKEANAIAGVFASALDLVDTLGGSSSEIEGAVVSIGPLLDSFSDCGFIGEENTAALLKAILQSDMVRSSIGFSMVQATDIANTINNSAKTDGSYVQLMKSLGNTVKIIRLTADNESTGEAVTELMKDITPASAEALKQLATPETVKNYGVPEESAAPVSQMFSDMFGNMADAKESGMSDEEYEKEAAAVSDMMSIAMTVGSSGGNSVFGEESATGVTATEYLDRATDSTVISTTLVNTVYGESEEATSDPLGLGITLADEEKTELVEALDTKWKTQLATSTDEAANAEYQKVLSSVAAIVNVNVSFTAGGVTLG